MIKIGVEVGQNTFSLLNIHETDTTLETWSQNLSFKPKCVNEKSPVEHHFPSGVLCCLLFHFFLFNPTTDRRNSTTVIMFLRTLWRDDAGNKETHANYKEGKRCEVRERYKNSQWAVKRAMKEYQWQWGLTGSQPTYLLCEKTSSATEGATSRGSQARSWWISCWAPRVRDRNDSCRRGKKKNHQYWFANNFHWQKIGNSEQCRSAIICGTKQQRKALSHSSPASAGDGKTNITSCLFS